MSSDKQPTFLEQSNYKEMSVKEQENLFWLAYELGRQRTHFNQGDVAFAFMAEKARLFDTMHEKEIEEKQSYYDVIDMFAAQACAEFQQHWSRFEI